jgi:MYXO-CTERM domain-containing protein
MSRTTTANGVLEAIYSIAGIVQPGEDDGEVFRGHPLAVPPRGAAAVFYGIWPALVVAGIFLHRRRHS